MLNEMTAEEATEVLKLIAIARDPRSTDDEFYFKQSIALDWAVNMACRVASGELVSVVHEENDSQQLCAENENFIQNKFGYCFYSLGPCPMVYNLYVDSQYRRCGHSKRLLELVISEIRKNGYDTKIYIQTVPKENSIGMKELTEYYKRMGLTIIKYDNESANVALKESEKE